MYIDIYPLPNKHNKVGYVYSYENLFTVISNYLSDHESQKMPMIVYGGGDRTAHTFNNIACLLEDVVYDETNNRFKGDIKRVEGKGFFPPCNDVQFTDLVKNLDLVLVSNSYGKINDDRVEIDKLLYFSVMLRKDVEPTIDQLIEFRHRKVTQLPTWP